MAYGTIICQKSSLDFVVRRLIAQSAFFYLDASQTLCYVLLKSFTVIVLLKNMKAKTECGLGDREYGGTMGYMDGNCTLSEILSTKNDIQH